MSDRLTQLYPVSGTPIPLPGLYLNPSIRDRQSAAPFIYSNFVTSLDGRIALAAAERKTPEVPRSIANDRDWRLFQELAAQADLLITSARYFRQSVRGESQDTLPIGPSAAFDDLRAWRLNRKLSPQPDIAIFSASLDIPPQALRAYENRRVLVLTGADADATARARLIGETHAEVVTCGPQSDVDGALVRGRLGELGYRFIYAIAGPAVLHTLAAGAALDRLYLTFVGRLLGGDSYDTLCRGPLLAPPVNLPLRSLYFDPSAPDGAGQLFAAFGN